MNKKSNVRVVVLISANVEWKAVCGLFPEKVPVSSPLGEWFIAELKVLKQPEPIVFHHGGWGKVSAAASTQYVIDHWEPELLVNLGTCGGFEGEVDLDTIMLVERTVIYDIYEQMTDPVAAIKHYSTDIDLSWLTEPLPMDVRRSLLVSADRDLHAGEISQLSRDYGAIAGDWESGAIAYVAARNAKRCLILREVSDLVSTEGGEVYGEFELYVERTEAIMQRLINALPAWVERSFENPPSS
jgi:adenosylhomocysteine nucleosidase